MQWHLDPDVLCEALCTPLAASWGACTDLCAVLLLQD
jgi:hypothetical protein